MKYHLFVTWVDGTTSTSIDFSPREVEAKARKWRNIALVSKVEVRPTILLKKVA